MDKENHLTTLTTEEKALTINRNQQNYGSFAEIGAGQEAARWFFQAGLSSNTIAKTMSAYDMTFSDTIYGKEETGGYVCESRLIKMLNHEYKLIEERLGQERGSTTHFFAFANTVAARSRLVAKGHGWLGIRFQKDSLKPPSDLVIHVNLLDPRNLLQQEAIGIVSVNLIFGALHFSGNLTQVLQSLTDNLKQDRIEVDMVSCSGPACAGGDHRLMNLYLVNFHLGPWVVFGPDKKVHQPYEILSKKNLLIHRGKPHSQSLPLLKSFVQKYSQKHKNNTLVLIDIALSDFLNSEGSNLSSVLSDIDDLNQQGYYVLINDDHTTADLSKRLKEQAIQSHTFIADTHTLEHLFHEPDQYKHLNGGILEGMGHLFDGNTQIYVYPHHTDDKNINLESFSPQAPYLNIYKYLIAEGKIKTVESFNL